MAELRLGAHMSVAGGVSQALDRAGSIGSNAVQLFTKNNRQWQGPPVDLDDVARWRTQRPALQIEEAVSHASYLINLASPQDAIWEKSVAAHLDELRRACAYDIAYVVLHPGAHTGSGPQAGIARIAAALDRIHAATPECSRTLTLLELMAGQGSTLGSSVLELRRILDQVDEPDRVAVCIDTCHAFAAGYDLRSVEGYERLLAELDRELGLDRVRCWHLNDSKGEMGSRVDRHTHLGEGQIGLDGFARIVNDRRWAGVPMLLETPKEDDLQEDIRNLRRLCTLIDDPARIPIGLRITAEEGDVL
jgi:deoxyribonuclease-4